MTGSVDRESPTGRPASGLPPADVAVIFGSGLAVVPEGLTVGREMSYAELGWAVGAVAGHGGRLLAAGRVLLAFGRSHLYEGRTAGELERPVRDLAAAGVRRLVAVCATGSLAADLRRGDVVVAHTVVDLQTAPGAEASLLPVCTPQAAAATACVLAPDLGARAGVYVAVPGPQYETPAEAAWLGGLGDVVGMSAAPEVRAGLAAGVAVRVLAVVTNPSGVGLAHDEVLAAGSVTAQPLRRALGRLVKAAAW